MQGGRKGLRAFVRGARVQSKHDNNGASFDKVSTDYDPTSFAQLRIGFSENTEKLREPFTLVTIINVNYK